jgi:hypothetical protein
MCLMRIGRLESRVGDQLTRLFFATPAQSLLHDCSPSRTPRTFGRCASCKGRSLSPRAKPCSFDSHPPKQSDVWTHLVVVKPV